MKNMFLNQSEKRTAILDNIFEKTLLKNLINVKCVETYIIKK